MGENIIELFSFFWKALKKINAIIKYIKKIIKFKFLYNILPSTKIEPSEYLEKLYPDILSIKVPDENW